jgi:hypothetical protein
MYTLEFVSDKQISNITFIYTSEFLTDKQISDIYLYIYFRISIRNSKVYIQVIFDICLSVRNFLRDKQIPDI